MALLGFLIKDQAKFQFTPPPPHTHTQESRRLLAERDGELLKLRSELDRYKQQAAREIANKTKLAQALDESHSHARELEELLQQWQMEVGVAGGCGFLYTPLYYRYRSTGIEPVISP